MTLSPQILERDHLVLGMGSKCGQRLLFRGDLPKAVLSVGEPLVGDGHLRLDPREFGRDRVQPSSAGHPGLFRLQLLQPGPFQPGLGRRQGRRHPRRLLPVRLQVSPHTGEDKLEFLQLRPRHRDLDRQTPLAQLPVPLRLPLLAGERADLGLHFGNHILDPLEIDLGGLQTSNRGAAPLLVLTDPRRFLEERPALVGSLREDCIDHPDLDDRVGVGAETRVAAQVDDITQATRGPIEPVVAATVAVDGPPYLHLLKRNGERSIVVRDDHRDRTAVHLPSRSRSLEDHLLHLRSADRGGPLLSKDPAHGVADVGFAAPVRADDRRDPLVKVHAGRVGEGFEAVEPDGFELHWTVKSWITTDRASPQSASRR